MEVFVFLVNMSPRRDRPFPYTTLFRSKGRLTEELKASSRLIAGGAECPAVLADGLAVDAPRTRLRPVSLRSEEHTSELQSHSDLVCRLLLEKKKKALTVRKRIHRRTTL